MCVSDIGLPLGPFAKSLIAEQGSGERESGERGAGGTDLQVGERTICVGAHLIAYTAHCAQCTDAQHSNTLYYTYSNRLLNTL